MNLIFLVPSIALKLTLLIWVILFLHAALYFSLFRFILLLYKRLFLFQRREYEIIEERSNSIFDILFQTPTYLAYPRFLAIHTIYPHQARVGLLQVSFEIFKAFIHLSTGVDAIDQ